MIRFSGDRDATTSMQVGAAGFVILIIGVIVMAATEL